MSLCQRAYHGVAFAPATGTPSAIAFYVGVPAKGNEPAQVWTFEAED